MANDLGHQDHEVASSGVMRARKDSSVGMCYAKKQWSENMSEPRTFNSGIWWERVVRRLSIWDAGCPGLVLLPTCSLASKSSFLDEALASKSVKSASGWTKSSASLMWHSETSFPHCDWWALVDYIQPFAIVKELTSSTTEPSLPISWFPGKQGSFAILI